MTMFRDRVRSAVESREPLDTPEFRRLAASAGGDDLTWWRDQVALERAIADWRVAIRRSRARAELSRRVALSVATVAACGAVVWLSASPPMELPATETVAALANAEAISAESITAPELFGAARGPVVAPRPAAPDGFAQASVTAERLAYALEPVGERVGTVLRFLVDSVPGADVFSM